MTKQTGSLRSRIRSGTVTRADVIRRLAELAFGDANDCVRLALEEGTPIRELDLRPAEGPGAAGPGGGQGC